MMYDVSSDTAPGAEAYFELFSRINSLIGPILTEVTQD
jgi:hypothetical protein